MNILYIGSAGALSLAPFKKLLNSGYSISAIGVYSPIILQNKVFALENESLALAANQLEITLIDLSQPVNTILQQCNQLSIDLIIMSCYGHRIPDALIDCASLGCFNMHPSLLPLYRGPEPIFWQMKNAADIGVSWHKVEHAFDAGDVVLQKKVFIDEAATYHEVNSQLADQGAQLLLTLLNELDVGKLTTEKQDSEMATYYPFPVQQDFILDTNGSARDAYNFMCATQAFGLSYSCQSGSKVFVLKSALDYDSNSHLDVAETQQDTLYIPFDEGILIASITAMITP